MPKTRKKKDRPIVLPFPIYITNDGKVIVAANVALTLKDLKKLVKVLESQKKQVWRT